MKKLFIGILLALFALNTSAQTKISEGVITYAVEWKLPPQAPAQMASMLPSEMKVYFKGDSSATVSKSPMASSTSILNPKTEYNRLLLDIPMMGKKFSVIFTPADLEQLQDQMPQFTLTAGNESKVIAGFKAQKFAIKEAKSGQTFDGWFTKDVEVIPNGLDRFFDKSYGFPLEFVTVQNGMGLKATVKEVKPEKVPAGSFSGTREYQEITFEELKGMMGGAR